MTNLHDPCETLFACPNLSLANDSASLESSIYRVRMDALGYLGPIQCLFQTEQNSNFVVYDT
jgi:hypothetical protein